jgi:hypothetical protein
METSSNGENATIVDGRIKTTMHPYVPCLAL